MQGKMMAYDRVVVELNAARLRGASFPVVHAFIQAAVSLNPDVSTLDDRQRGLFRLLYFSERIRSYRCFTYLQK
jgi:hypothetical protein